MGKMICFIFILWCVLIQNIFGRTTTKPDIDVTSGDICSCDNHLFNKQSLDDVNDDEIPFRIVGGDVTTPHAYPQIVRVKYLNRVCAGTIINNNYILTAAHCTRNRPNLKLYKVKIGKHDLSRDEPHEKIFGVKKVIVHPHFDSSTGDNDVAVMELSSPITFNSHVKPTCLPLIARSYVKKIGVAVGWGHTEEDGSRSDTLREVDLPILATSLCKTYYGSKNRNFNTMFCAGYSRGEKDTCQSDSGGPIFLKFTSPPTQVGVISFGDGCARPHKPGVNADVGYNMKFIMDNTKVNAGCQIYSNDK